MILHLLTKCNSRALRRYNFLHRSNIHLQVMRVVTSVCILSCLLMARQVCSEISVKLGRAYENAVGPILSPSGKPMNVLYIVCDDLRP